MYFHISDKRSWVKSLMLGCPMGTALPDCPLTIYRKLDVKTRMGTVNRMSDDRIDGIIYYHTECIRQREALAP